MGRKGQRERARRGDGSIDDFRGRKRGRITIVDALGRRKRKVVYGRTEGEVRTKMLQLRVDGEKRRRDGGKELLGPYLDRWIEAHAQTVRTVTANGYRSWIRTHLKPLLGHLPLREIEPAHVQALMDELRRKSVSPTTRKAVLATLRVALERAIDLDILDRNPAGRIRAPRIAKTPRIAWTPQQVAFFLEAVRDDRLWPLYLTALATGMRESELLGLRWRDVDLELGTIRVEQRLDAATHELDAPKSRSGRRQVDVPASVVSELRAHRKRLAARERMSPWVFPAVNGSPLRPSNFLRYSFVPAIALADALARAELEPEHAFDPNEGVPLIHFHDLRHTAGVLMRRLGIDLRTISDRLGHSSVAFTQDVYGHIVPDLDREAARALESVFGPAVRRSNEERDVQ